MERHQAQVLQVALTQDLAQPCFTNFGCVSYSFVARDVECLGGGKENFWFGTLGVLTNAVSALKRGRNLLPAQV